MRFTEIQDTPRLLRNHPFLLYKKIKGVIILTILLCFLCITCVCAKDYTLKNNKIQVVVSVNDTTKLTQITSLKDLTTGQEFISKTLRENNLWHIKVKPDKKYSQKEFEKLTPQDAKDIEAKIVGKTLTLTFFGVTNKTVKDEFKVICTVNLKDVNSYWDIKVKCSPTPHYAIWEVTYPYIDSINCEDGDRYYIPSRGDAFVEEFSNPNGFPDPRIDSPDAYTKYYSKLYPLLIQYTSLTKGKSTMYVCPEDATTCVKGHELYMPTPGAMDSYNTYYPEYMCVAGHDFVSSSKFNIALFKGDWYDAAKKYRAWGIKANYAPFSMGKIEDRKDLPQWWKDICINVRTWGDGGVNEAINTAEEYEMPMLVHLYLWGAYPFDTHYPDWTPINDTYKEYLKKFEKANCYVMPYTNAHIVDINLSETAKNTPDILKIRWDGNPYYENWAADKGASNNVACIAGPYYDVYLNEVRRIFKEYPFDAFYMDQVGASGSGSCFNENHNHPVGGGTFDYVGYNNLLKDIRKIVKEETGKDVVITTEDGGDAYAFDGWLKVNECPFKSENNPVRTLVYSGYVTNFGDNMNPSECLDMTGFSRIASQLTNGYVLGWQYFLDEAFKKNEELKAYSKNCAKARYSAKEFFNLGEMVRDINITSDMPKVPIKWYHHSDPKDANNNLIPYVGECRGIKSCAYTYKGKGMICITNTTKEAQKVDWNTTAKNLGLKNKSEYKISEIYPETNVISKGKTISDSFIMNPLETVVYVVE